MTRALMRGDEWPAASQGRAPGQPACRRVRDLSSCNQAAQFEIEEGFFGSVRRRVSDTSESGILELGALRSE